MRSIYVYIKRCGIFILTTWKHDLRTYEIEYDGELIYGDNYVRIRLRRNLSVVFVVDKITNSSLKKKKGREKGQRTCFLDRKIKVDDDTALIKD